ncbi:MAG: aminotransferase class I/II-fold pyridoxal phosphate-dependent enzyme [Chloroflexi bacterium]|nr:aminotransferase class I/II-fold pyridoxal phosphate-dependent enzyme [Chloroflexota bacterium]
MPEVISLGIGEPDFVTPQPIAQAGLRSLEAGETKYTSNAGILELRETLADHLEELYGVRYAPKGEMFMTVGVSEALLLAMTALLDPGDEVIIPTPCFMAYQADVLLAGGVPVEVASTVEENFQLNPQKIESAITPKTKAILVGYPNNPTGAVASPEILKQVISIAEEHDLIVLSDEIYDQLVYGQPHVCVSSLPGAKERTILMGGFSKDYAMTGWRVGYACGPEEIIAGMLRVHQYAIMSAPTTSQVAAIEALNHGAEHVAAMRAEYDRRRRLIVDGFNSMGLHTFEPGGAFFAFPQISSTGLDDETFAERLLKEEQVAVVPGSVFGPGGAGFVRCSYATAYEQIEEALVRIERFGKSL